MELKLGIINYNAGNIFSVSSAFRHLGLHPHLVTKPDELNSLTHLILPGVGSYAHCYDKLKSAGLVGKIREWVLEKKKPLLGICVGMQLLSDYGEEMGGSEGLGLIRGVVRRMPKVEDFRIPHVGWNEISLREDEYFSAGQLNGDYYFDHSFSFCPASATNILATVHHGVEIVAAVKSGNLVGTQFHPEKSQSKGLNLLRTFVRL